jgi:hypothetical protein
MILYTAVQNGTTITGILTPGDNVWADVNNSGWTIAWQVVLASCSLVNIIVALSRLIFFTIHSKTFQSYLLPKVVTSLTLIANVIRLIFVAVDPLGMRRVRSFYCEHVFRTLSLDFTAACVVIIIFYWNEQLTYVQMNVTFVRKLQVPLIVAIVLIFALEATAQIIRAELPLFSLASIINGIPYLLMATPLAIFYIVTASRVLRATKKSKKLTTTKPKRIRTLALMMLLAGILGILLVLTTALLLNPNFLIPVAQYTLFFLIYFLADCLDFVQVIVFRPTTKENASSSSLQNKPTQTSNMSPLSMERQSKNTYNSTVTDPKHSKIVISSSPTIKTSSWNETSSKKTFPNTVQTDGTNPVSSSEETPKSISSALHNDDETQLHGSYNNE